MDFSRDPVVNAIYNGIKKGVKIALENDCYGSALILIYAGIDAMANLSRPENQKEVQRADFTGWVERYIRIGSKEKITGEEFYSARCAVVHTYGVESVMTLGGKARKIGYVVGGYPPIRFDPAKALDLLLLDIEALADAFFKGIDEFLVDAFADAQKRRTFEERANQLLALLPVSSQK